MHSGTTWYLHGDNNDLFYEKEVRADGTIEHKHYLSAGGITFAIQTLREGVLNGKPARALNYLHHDHLGSVAAVTDEAGAVIERMAYDPWGKRRFTNGTADTSDSIVPGSTDRGFTMHEHLDELGIIHMNGRIYDPYTGRFMSADPFIQSPDNLQSYNRYAYVMNNPLNMTDPSGYFSLRKLFRAAVAIAIAVYAPQFFDTYGMAVQGMSSGMAHAINVAAAGALSAGVSSGGNVNAMVNGALTAGLFNFVGGMDGLSNSSRILAHGAVGCVSSVAGGGQCGQGMASAMFGKYTTIAIGEGGGWIQGHIAKGVATAIAGGVGSVIAGGKFDNGAATAAMGYLFNQAATILRLAGTYGPPLVAAAATQLDNLKEGARALSVMLSEVADNTAPPIPGDLVGDQSSDSAGLTKNGKRHTSGPMTPENGGTGDASKDFDKLTGGRSQPAGGTYPPGTLVGPNGVVLRPGQKGSGPRIDIPGNGSKPPETLHY
jgi:RHS repeat-associated protein